jgi:hypothetical protein
MFSSSKRFNGEIHVIFNKSQDALAFVQQSKLTPINYGNGYTLVCKLLNDDLNRDLIKQEDQHSFIKGKRIETMNIYYLNEMIFFIGKSFSTRLSNHSPRVSFNTNISLTNENPGK